MTLSSCETTIAVGWFILPSWPREQWSLRFSVLDMGFNLECLIESHERHVATLPHCNDPSGPCVFIAAYIWRCSWDVWLVDGWGVETRYRWHSVKCYRIVVNLTWELPDRLHYHIIILLVMRKLVVMRKLLVSSSPCVPSGILPAHYRVVSDLRCRYSLHAPIIHGSLPRNDLTGK